MQPNGVNGIFLATAGMGSSRGNNASGPETVAGTGTDRPRLTATVDASRRKPRLPIRVPLFQERAPHAFSVPHQAGSPSDP